MREERREEKGGERRKKKGEFVVTISPLSLASRACIVIFCVHLHVIRLPLRRRHRSSPGRPATEASGGWGTPGQPLVRAEIFLLLLSLRV